MAPTGPTPPRQEVAPDRFAIHVTSEWLQVWQYRVRGLDQAGDWHHVETIPADEDTRLSVEWAAPTPPTDDGYWLYCRAYECSLNCAPDDETGESLREGRTR